MKRTLYKREDIEIEATPATLKYYLLEQKLEIDGCVIKCYGIEIKKSTPHHPCELSEAKQISNAFFNKSEALLFLEKLAQNTVTPIALAGVLEDYITEEVRSRKRLPILM